MAKCCGAAEANLLNPTGNSNKLDTPILCLLPLDDISKLAASQEGTPRAVSANTTEDVQLLDDAHIKKHFKLPSRPLYMDPSKRPLITFPMTQEASNHFNMARKNKINQHILDGVLDPSAAITSGVELLPSKYKSDKKQGNEEEDDDEIIYILQLPDLETQCSIHNQTIKTPRFLWHSGKKSEKKPVPSPGGPKNKPKPGILSRHTDFDLISQW